MRHFCSFWLLFLCFFLSGCTRVEHVENPTFARGTEKIAAIATTGMVGDIVQNVGGEAVQVQSLMGAGVDPHLYKASLSDLIALGESDIVFYSGLHLEGRMSELLERFNKRKPTVAVTEDIARERLLFPEGAGESADPHAWFDVQLWIEATREVEAALKKFDPARAAQYERNAAAYIAELAALDVYARRQIALIPRERRVLVTAHDAFGYFGRAYDIEVVALQGLSTATEYGLRDVARIVNLLRNRGVKAIFVESSVPKRAVEAVVQGAKSRGHEVRIGGELFSDAMGAKNTPEGSYIGMVRHNVDTIVEALK